MYPLLTFSFQTIVYNQALSVLEFVMLECIITCTNVKFQTYDMPNNYMYVIRLGHYDVMTLVHVPLHVYNATLQKMTCAEIVTNSIPHKKMLMHIS